MLPFQLAVLSLNFNNQGSRSTFVRARRDRGMPRYVHGKCFTDTPSGCRSWCRSRSPQRMGMAELLEILVCSPVTLPKKLSSSFIILASDIDGLMNSTTSSAYKEQRMTCRRPGSFESRPCSVARFMMRYNGSMAKTNRNGEMGSPCLNPFLCTTDSDRPPLIRTRDEEVRNSIAIHSLHLSLNPLALSMSNR